MGKKRSQLVDQLTEIILVAHGYDDEETDNEWDGDDPDSQYSVVREDVDLIISSLEQRGLIKL